MQKIKSITYCTAQSSRSTTWIRVFSEILLGFALANNFNQDAFLKLTLIFLAAGPFMWTAAYMLNDLSDIALDRQHPMRKNRPLASGKMTISSAKTVIFLLIIASFVLGILINDSTVLLLIMLLLSQMLYTMHPIRMKEKAPFDIILNATNAGIRFILGYIAGSGEWNVFPIGMFVFAVGLKTLLFIGHRLQNRELEIRNHFASTVALLSIKQIHMLMLVTAAITSFSYLFSIIKGTLNMFQLIPPLLTSLLTIPLIVVLKRGYLHGKEKSLHTRIYIYLVLLFFSVIFLFVQILI